MKMLPTVRSDAPASGPVYGGEVGTLQATLTPNPNPYYHANTKGTLQYIIAVTSVVDNTNPYPNP